MKTIEETDETLSTIPNEKWRQFLAKFAEVDTLPIEQWKILHVLGYFAKRYQETFGKPYSFKFNTPLPLKSFEVFQVKSLSGRLSSKPVILKDYIDWFYQGVVKEKKRFSSISAMTKDQLVNEFKWKILSPPLTGNKSALSLNRSTPLPSSHQEVLSDFGFPLKTYGDLSFTSHCYKDANSDEARRFHEVLLHLKLAGFDESVLDRIV